MCQAQPVFPFWLSFNLLSLITEALRDGLSGDIDEVVLNMSMNNVASRIESDNTLGLKSNEI